MADQKLKKAAEELRSKGRGGDTILAHINPHEAAMLKMMGGSGTKNPDTGLPEYFVMYSEEGPPTDGSITPAGTTYYYTKAPTSSPGLLGGLSNELSKIDPSTAISRELTNLYQPVEKAISTGLADVDKNLSLSKNAPVAASIALAFVVPIIGEAIGASLLDAGVLAAGTTPATATTIGTAIANATRMVAQGSSVEEAVTNAVSYASINSQVPGIAKQLDDVVKNPAVTNLITSSAASAVQTKVNGGSDTDVINNVKGALVGSGVSSATDSNIAGRAAGGAVTGGVAGALTGAAGAAGADAAKAGATPTTTPTTQATLTPNLTDAQVSQIQNALGISVSDATNNDVKLALGPLLAPLGAGAAIVSDSVIPLIGIFGAKAVSDTIDYFKNQNDSAGFYKWVNENMQAADDRVQNKQSLNPAGAGRGFVNPPVATPITPSQAAVTGTYGAGFSGAGGGAGAGVTAGEATAGEQEARDFLAAQKVTHPEIDFATLAQEPALNELPADKKIADLIQPGAAATAAVPPGTAPTDQDILNLTGITQPGTSTVTPSTVTAPVEQTPTTVTPTTVTPKTFTPATFTPAVPIVPTRPANQPVVDTFDFPTTTPADKAIIDLINPPATTPEVVTEPPPILPVIPPAVEPPPVVSEPPPDVVQPPPVVTEPPPFPPPEVEVEPEPPVVEDKPVVEEKPPEVEKKPSVVDEPPPDDKKPPVDEVVEPEYKPETFIYGGVAPKTKTRTRTDLSTTLQAPFYPSSTLGQALTGYRGAGEIEGKKSGKPRKNVWNEESLRLKDALGL
jgi:hypothetical protein